MIERKQEEVLSAKCDICGVTVDDVTGETQEKLAGWRRIYASTSHVMPYVGGGEDLITTDENVICSEKCIAEYLYRLARQIEERQGHRLQHDLDFLNKSSSTQDERIAPDK